MQRKRKLPFDKQYEDWSDWTHKFFTNVITKSFPPEIGGMQNLTWGLTTSLAKFNLVKVFADYHEGSEEHDSKVSFSIERVGGIKLLRRYRKAVLINEFIKNVE